MAGRGRARGDSARPLAGVLRVQRSEISTKERHASTRRPLQRLRVRFDELRSAYRALERLAASREDPDLLVRADQIVERANTEIGSAASRLRELRAGDPRKVSKP